MCPRYLLFRKCRECVHAVPEPATGKSQIIHATKLHRSVSASANQCVLDKDITAANNRNRVSGCPIEISNDDAVVSAPIEEGCVCRATGRRVLQEELIAALSLCDGFVGADGGAMHLAAALNLKTAALFENSEAKRTRWYPWGARHVLLQPTTFAVADISVDQVEAAVRELEGT